MVKPVEAQAEKQPEKQPEKVKYIVRIANTDLDGSKNVIISLQKIKGLSMSFANALCNIAGINKNAKMGLISDADIAKLNGLIQNPSSVLPTWMLNRQKDYETGEDKHLIAGDLTYTVENDVRRLKMIKARRGMRHAFGLPLRGQKTRSNHRKTKSKKSAASKRGAKKAPVAAKPQTK